MRSISLLAFFLVIFLELGLIFPNQYTGSKTSVCLVSPNQGNQYYSFSTFGEDIGYKYNSTAQESETARAKYAFDFSGIPSNATISNVSLSLSAGNYQNSQYTYTITQLTGNIINLSDLWNGIHSSTALFTNILYSSGNPSGSYTALTTLINNNKGGNIYLGVYSQNEGNSDSYANLTMTLNMDVSVPPTNITITADNNFNISPANDGQINITGYGQKTAPFPFQINIGQTATFTAVPDQQDGQNYQRVWSYSAPVYNSQWREYKASGPIQLNNTITNISYTTVSLTNNDNNATFEAGLRKVCNITVQNSFVGGGNGGTIIANGTQGNSPTVTPVIEQNPITVSAQDQTVLGIDYVFTGWYDGPASNPNANLISTQRTPPTFYPGGNANYYAHFIGTPNISIMGLHSNNGNVGQNPTIYWSDNVNLNVSYDIYRQYYDGTTWSSWSNVGHVNKGVGQFVDGQDNLVSGKSITLELKLNAVYSVENTLTCAGAAIFDAKSRWQEKRNFGNNQTAAITEYKLYNNFPNPFNPSTEIYYQLPTDGNVKLKIYNMMGQEIMTLVNEFKEKGMYDITFNAGKLASGMYIYKLEAGSFVQVKKMILTK